MIHLLQMDEGFGEREVWCGIKEYYINVPDDDETFDDVGVGPQIVAERHPSKVDCEECLKAIMSLGTAAELQLNYLLASKL